MFVCALDQLIEYKYVVGNTHGPEKWPLKWEEGPNRELNFMRSSDLEYPLSKTFRNPSTVNLKFLQTTSGTTGS